MRLIASLRSLRRCESGAAAVEFALIGMVAISTFVGTVEFGRALYVRNALSFAADVAARAILTNPAVADSDLETVIRSSVAFGDSTDLEMTFGVEMASGVSFRTLSVQQPLTLVVPGLSGAGVMLTVDRRVPVL